MSSCLIQLDKCLLQMPCILMGLEQLYYIYNFFLTASQRKKPSPSCLITKINKSKTCCSDRVLREENELWCSLICLGRCELLIRHRERDRHTADPSSHHQPFWIEIPQWGNSESAWLRYSSSRQHFGIGHLAGNILAQIRGWVERADAGGVGCNEQEA